MGWTIWCIGWIYTGEIDSREYGFWQGLGLFFYWPERLAQIHKKQKNEK